MKDLDTPLGRAVDYSDQYNPGLLYPIARADARTAMAEDSMCGFDLWTAYELSWLNAQGLPRVAIAEFHFPAESPNLVESKSFKLYLNSLNQTRFADNETLMTSLERDLSAACGAGVVVTLKGADDYCVRQPGDYLLLDTLDVAIERYQPDASLLQQDDGGDVSVRWCSHLFRSLCPVTGQPDWASVYIDYHGPSLTPESLLQYLVSYRQHQGFHEQCVEQIYGDIMTCCRPQKLVVNARFLRRGGLDINPVRSSEPVHLQRWRTARQ